jgi:hypothetical protein
MICGHCSKKHEAVVEVARCAYTAYSSSKDGVTPAFRKAMDARFKTKKEVKA